MSEAHLGLLLDLSSRLDQAGDAEAAIEALEQVVVIDPLHEGAHRALMRLFAAAGRRQHALAADRVDELYRARPGAAGGHPSA